MCALEFDSDNPLVVDRRPIIASNRYGSFDVSCQQYFFGKGENEHTLWGDIIHMHNDSGVANIMQSLHERADQESSGESAIRLKEYKIGGADSVFLVEEERAGNAPERYILARKGNFMVRLSNTTEYPSYQPCELEIEKNPGLALIIKSIFSDKNFQRAVKEREKDSRHTSIRDRTNNASEKLRIAVGDMPAGWGVENISTTESYNINEKRVTGFFDDTKIITRDGFRYEDHVSNPGELGYRAYHYSMEGNIEIRMMTRLMWAHQFAGPSHRDEYSAEAEKKGIENIINAIAKDPNEKGGINSTTKNELKRFTKLVDKHLRHAYAQRIENLASLKDEHNNLVGNPVRAVYNAANQISFCTRKLGAEAAKLTKAKKYVLDMPVTYLQDTQSQNFKLDKAYMLAETMQKLKYMISKNPSLTEKNNKTTHLDNFNSALRERVAESILQCYKRMGNSADSASAVQDAAHISGDYRSRFLEGIYAEERSADGLKTETEKESNALYELFIENVKAYLNNEGARAYEAYAKRDIFKLIQSMPGAMRIERKSLEELSRKAVSVYMNSFADIIEKSVETGGKHKLERNMIVSALFSLYGERLNEKEYGGALDGAVQRNLSTRMDTLLENYFTPEVSGKRFFVHNDTTRDEIMSKLKPESGRPRQLVKLMKESYGLSETDILGASEMLVSMYNSMTRKNIGLDVFGF